jgi:hypothetical protein
MANHANNPNVGVDTYGQPSAVSHDVVRLWRVRKSHTWIDAQIANRPATTTTLLHFFLDGERVFSREFPTRALATAEAHCRLRDLQRAGWTTHW